MVVGEPMTAPSIFPRRMLLTLFGFSSECRFAASYTAYARQRFLVGQMKSVIRCPRSYLSGYTHLDQMGNPATLVYFMFPRVHFGPAREKLARSWIGGVYTVHRVYSIRCQGCR
uniref:Uncharacterized protein n=1 Tax=Cacopsylla melanoneura TaxID=428564 RepID=A0A8D8W8Q2_9HEMI